MPNYVILVNLTDQGAKTAKEIPARARAAREAAEKAGGKWVSWFLTLGAYDAVIITEFPDDPTCMRFTLGLASLGNVRTTTLKAFTHAEVEKIAGAMG